MFKKITKRIFPIILAIVLIVSVTPLHTFAAKTVYMLDNALSLADTASKISVSGTTATIKAEGWLSAGSNTVTIRNESGSKAILSFDYSLSNLSKGSVSIDGHSVTADARGYSKVLEAEGTLVIAVTANKGSIISSNTVTVTLSNVALKTVSGASDVTVNYDAALGSVTMDGNVVASGDTQSVESTELVAKPNSGSTFLGWVDEATNQIISESTTYTFSPSGAATLKAVFVNSSSQAYFRVNSTESSYFYTDLNAASDMAATVSKKVIILANNGRLAAGDYTIDAGVTLLIPFDSANTLYTTTPANTGYTGTAYINAVAVPWTQPRVYRKLTMASGANITVDGAISLSAKHAAAAGGKRGGGSPSGPCSYIYMEENTNITVNANAALYAWGYIYGKGSVYAKSGATIYENFQIEDFRGGTQTTEMKDGPVFPMSQYYIQNIEVPLTIESGAKETCYTSIFMSKTDFSSAVGFFSDGTSDGSMFNLTRGTVTKRYDPATDRLIVELNGDMTISPISMNIGGTGFNSENFVLPVNSNISIIANEGSNVTMAQDIAVLPGANIKIKEGATAKLNSGKSIYLYDSEQWGGYVAPSNVKFLPVQYSPSRKYTRTEADLVDAFIEVNGTLDATLGNFYTTAGGARVFSTGSGVVKMGSTTDSVTKQLVQNTGFTEIPVTPAKLLNGDGTYLQTGNDNYTYANNKWNCEKHIAGPEATCTEDQVCTVCGEVLNAATGHNHNAVVTDPTCTERGYTTYTCACGDTYVDDYVDAAGHKPGADATCTEDQVCTVCGDVLVEAHGHSYSDEWTVDVEPTHTTDGSKSHHCTVCGDKTDITVIEAYGYDINGNGETEINDYYYTKHLILGSAKYDEADLPKLDFNGDKKFDILDLIKYYTILQGII
ncbi:MAG: hypothetical protein PUF48_02675 [Oscillospiraceae bacterium]|nr:hypothetical protein [Oscillospiraceae bacterium]